MKRRTEEELVGIIWGNLSRASDFSTSQLQETRRKAWNYYLNRPRGDEQEGRSQVQDTTIRDTHHALMSTIMPAYSTDNIVQFEPCAAGDEDQAEAESAAVNNIFTEDNSGYTQLNNAVSDALLFANGVMKVWLDDQVDKQTVVLEPSVTDGAVRAYYKAEGSEVTAIDRSDDAVTVQIERTTQKLRTESIEPSYFYVDPNAQDQNIQSHRFIAERVILMRSELEEMGVSRAKVKQLTEITDEGMVAGAGITAVDVAAKYIGEQPTYEQAATYAEQRCECYWVHMLIDGEKWRFLIGSQILLLKSPVSYFPYATGAAWPVSHRWAGLSLYDLLRQTQDSKTSILRQYLDNLNVANNASPIFDPATTNTDDLLARAPGRGLRSKDPASVGWMPTVDVTTQSLAGLSYFDEAATRQAGAALDMASAEAQSVKDVSGLSVEMQTAPKEQMASQISRNLAETLVRNTFLLIHRVLREEWSGTITFRRTDEWVDVNPSEWKPRNRINITVGLSPGDRRRHRAALEFVMARQMELIVGGAANIGATYKNWHNAMSDWLKAAELDGAEGYFLDPDGRESQAGQQAAAQAAQSQIDPTQVAIQLEGAKLQEDARQHDTELQFKYTELAQEGEVEEAKLVADGIKASISAATGAGTGEAGRANGADRGNQG
jgi:hypothetical protein